MSNLRALRQEPEPGENPQGDGLQVNGRQLYPRVHNFRVPDAQLAEVRKEWGGLVDNRQDTDHNNAVIRGRQLTERFVQARRNELARGVLSVKDTMEAGDAIQDLCLRRPQDSLAGLMGDDLAGQITTDMVASDAQYRELHRTCSLEIAEKGK